MRASVILAISSSWTPGRTRNTDRSPADMARAAMDPWSSWFMISQCTRALGQARTAICSATQATPLPKRQSPITDPWSTSTAPQQTNRSTSNQGQRHVDRVAAQAFRLNLELIVVLGVRRRGSEVERRGTPRHQPRRRAGTSSVRIPPALFGWKNAAVTSPPSGRPPRSIWRMPWARSRAASAATSSQP